MAQRAARGVGDDGGLRIIVEILKVIFTKHSNVFFNRWVAETWKILSSHR